MRIALDENFDYDIIKGVLQYLPDLDVVSAQDVGLHGAPDEIILEWAAREGRVLFTHDARTMPTPAYARIAAGQKMTGVFIVRWASQLGPIIEDLLLLANASRPGEWEGQVSYLPF